MDNPSRVTKVDAIDELKHEQFNLLLRYCVLILMQEFFEIILCKLKNQMKFFLTGQVEYFHETG